jgi:hypothetical protein
LDSFLEVCDYSTKITIKQRIDFIRRGVVSAPVGTDPSLNPRRGVVSAPVGTDPSLNPRRGVVSAPVELVSLP